MSNASLTRNKYMVCVDRGDVSKVAVRFACAKAKKNGNPVELIHVIEPADFQSLFAVTDKVREERRHEAENLLQELGALAQAAGVTPSMNLREGARGEEILKATLEDPDVGTLVIGMETTESGQSKLVPWLLSRLGDKLLVPVMVVPGTLTDQQIEGLA
jgi:nucleotide-binding universal stress UspA family protein